MKRDALADDAQASAPERVRLDKWLWAARFYRTRSLAAEAIDAGHVRVDGERVKTAHPVRESSRVTVRKRDLTWEVDVRRVSERRKAAPEAALLYRETADSAALRARLQDEHRAGRGAVTPGRPTKRDRRKLEDFLDEP